MRGNISVKHRFVTVTERRLRRRLAIPEREQAFEQETRLATSREKVEVDNLLARLKFALVEVTGRPLHEVVTWPGERVVKEIEQRLKVENDQPANGR